MLDLVKSTRNELTAHQWVDKEHVLSFLKITCGQHNNDRDTVTLNGELGKALVYTAIEFGKLININ